MWSARNSGGQNTPDTPAELPAEDPPMSELGLLEQLQARLDSVEIPPGNPV